MSSEQSDESADDAATRIPRWIRVYVFPAAVFQSVLIGGGYGTGRETVEYVTQAGGSGGVLSVLWFFVVLTVVLGASFEFARVFRTFDYRHFFKTLLGRAWWTYEVLAVLLLLLVLQTNLSPKFCGLARSSAGALAMIGTSLSLSR